MTGLGHLVAHRSDYPFHPSWQLVTGKPQDTGMVLHPTTDCLLFRTETQQELFSRRLGPTARCRMYQPHAETLELPRNLRNALVSEH